MEVQTTILYSIESFSFAPSIYVTKNPAPTFLSSLPGDTEKTINKIVCKSEGYAFFSEMETNNKILPNEPSFVFSLFFQ